MPRPLELSEGPLVVGVESGGGWPRLSCEVVPAFKAPVSLCHTEKQKLNALKDRAL